MDPLVVIDHIPKSAGVALRQIARANYRPDEFIALEREAGGISDQRSDPGRAEGRMRELNQFYGTLPPERRARVRCIAGYAAPLVIPGVTDRPVRAVCMLRDPVEYVLSYYLFQQWRAEATGDRTPLTEALRERRWTLKDVYRGLGGAEKPTSHLELVFSPLFNGQARHLLLGRLGWTEIPFRTDRESLAPYRDRALALLEETYLVGTQDRFSESIRLFADSLGWRLAFVPRVNAGRLRGGLREAEIDEETRDLIRAHNWVDGELHARYSLLLEGRPGVGRLSDLEGRLRRRGRRSVARLRRGAARARGRARRLRT